MNPNDNTPVQVLSQQITDPFILGVIDLAARIVLYGTAIAVLMVLFGGIVYFTGLSRNLGKKAIQGAIGIFLLCAVIYLGLLGADAMPDLSTVFHVPT